MTSSWQDFLGASGAHFDHDNQNIVTDFGDLAAELVSARDATVIAPLVHLGLIECSGDDATSFLHNQLTNDVNHLGSSSAQHAAWCTAKGRMLASFLLYRKAGGFQALLSKDLLAGVHKRLQMFILRSKVKLADHSDQQTVFGLSGAQSGAALTNAALPVPARLMETNTFVHGEVIRLDDARLIVVVENAMAAELWQKLAANARPVGTTVWHWLDIQAGIPLITEATKEAFIPQMANFDKIGGVSFNKGCYPGQEVVARTKYLGKVKRHLYRIRTDVAMKAGDWLCSPDSPETACGMIANAAPSPNGGFDALGVIQENFVEAGNLHLGTPDGPTIRVELIES